MGYSNFKINGKPFKNPSDFDMEHYTLTQSTRTADGNMVMDFVANKRKFIFKYDVISSDDLNLIIEELWKKLEVTRQCFHTLTYIEDGTPKEAIVYAGAIPKKLHRGYGAKWVWKEVSFSLIER